MISKKKGGNVSVPRRNGTYVVPRQSLAGGEITWGGEKGNTRPKVVRGGHFGFQQHLRDLGEDWMLRKKKKRFTLKKKKTDRKHLVRREGRGRFCLASDERQGRAKKGGKGGNFVNQKKPSSFSRTHTNDLKIKKEKNYAVGSRTRFLRDLPPRINSKREKPKARF